MSFRPDETFNPITWTGEVVKYQPPEPEKPKNSDKSKDSKKGENQ